MQKLIRTFTLGLLGMLFAGYGLTHAQNFSGSTYAEALENGAGDITVVYLEEDAFAYMDENGNLSGIHIDIFEHFSNWLRNSKGINLDINYVGEAESFARFYSSIQNAEGGVFGLGTVTILERRKSEVSFSPPFLTNIAVLVTHDDVPEIESMEDMSTAFSDLTGLNITGTTLEDRMRELQESHLPNMPLRNVESQVEALELIVNNPEYFCYLDLSIYWPAMQQGQSIRRHAVGDQASELFGYIMPVDSDWAPVIEEFFNLGSGYRGTATYRNTLVRHLGVEVTRMLELARRQTD